MTLPLTILGGYLGAGKTTLINHLLRNASGQRLGVLVNEFGALAIDADLIEIDDGDIVSLAGGCACCSFGDDLAGAIKKLCALDPPLDHLLLEASGVAMPGAIASAVNLIGDIAVQGIVVLSDAELLPGLLKNDYLSDTIARQLGAADVVVLNKSDLVSIHEIGIIEDLIRTHAPKASVLKAIEARIPPDLILAEYVTKEHGPQMDHFPHLVVKNLEMADPVDPMKFAEEFAEDKAVLRAKGHFISDQDNEVWTLQLVGKRFRLTRSDAPRKLGVVVLSLAADADT